MYVATHDVEKQILALTIGALAVTTWQPASAQESAGIEEVLVTAQKRTESLQDVAIAVSAFSGEDLQKFGVGGTQSLQTTTPGLVYNNTGPNGQPYLRGVGSRLTGNGLESSVATYVDDRYVPDAAAAMFDFADIERVEVLKGPQGTLYGRNSTGGAIRIISKDVADEFEGSLTGSAGNYQYYSLGGTVSVPLSETFGVRVSAMSKQRDGYTDNLVAAGPDEIDDQDFQSFRTKFRWRPSDNFTARLTIDYWERDDLTGDDIVPLEPVNLFRAVSLGGVYGADPDEAATAMREKNDGDELSAQLRLDASFSRFDFASISVYSDLDLQRVSDVDTTSLVVADVQQIGGPRIYSQEFQLLSPADSKLRWIVGTYLYDSKGDQEVILNGAISQGRQVVDTSAWSVFGQVGWPFADRWTLTLGGRWNSEEKEAHIRSSSRVATTVGAAFFPFDAKDDWQEFTPKATLDYTFDAGMVYASYARGFKSGGFNYPARGTEPLDPEILDMYELGFKSEFLNRTLRLNGSLYYYDYVDLQVTRAARDNPGVAVIENAADSEVLGLDLDVTWMATDQLTLTAGLNVLDTEYKTFEASAFAFNSVLTGNPVAAGMSSVFYDASGQDMLRAPNWSGFVSLDYEFALGDASLPLTLTYSYKDDYEFDFIADPSTERLRQDAYGLLTARLAYVSPSKKWVVAAWGSNLTDEEYFDDIVASGQGIRGSYGAPRTYGADITFNF